VDPHGVLIIDKPAGPTSHDVVDRARRVLHTRKIGHTGTLDPFASGVLPLCVGKATRLARFFSGHDKAYTATVRFGYATTTDDLAGEPLGPAQGVALDLDRLREAAHVFVGRIEQLPPAYSAKRTAGQRHHDLARAGKPVERTPCSVTILSLDVRAVEGDRAEIDVVCSAGTYVRALARDLGERLGVGAHLLALRRTRSGPLSLDDALPLADLESGVAEARLIAMGKLLPELPAVTVGESGRMALRYGRSLAPAHVLSGFPEAPPPERLRILDEAGNLLALGVPRGFGQSTPGLPVDLLIHPDIVLLD
jgi:tRNA pseudouridine55 synthase